jgi:hypothetical protein
LKSVQIQNLFHLKFLQIPNLFHLKSIQIQKLFKIKVYSDSKICSILKFVKIQKFVPLNNLFNFEYVQT